MDYKEMDIPNLLKEKERLVKVESRIRNLENIRKEKQLESNGLIDQIEDEYRDVKRLEQIGLTSIFYRILGNKEEQLEHERQEYLEAILRFDGLAKEIELIDFELTVLKEQLKRQKSLKLALDREIINKETQLLRENSSIAQSLKRINERLQAMNRGRAQILEALELAEMVLPVLNDMISKMEGESEWGDWEAMDDGTLSKKLNAHLDRMRQLSYKAQKLLDQLSAELDDVFIDHKYSFKIKTRSLESFLEILVENLISDWIVLKKIWHSYNNVRSARDQVERIRMTLENELKRINGEINTQQEKKKALILRG